LEQLDLSWSGIVSIPPCIKRFVSWKFLKLNNCKRLREILAFPPNAYCVEAEGCHRKKNGFNILVSGNKIPDWFNYRKVASNSDSCEIDIDMPTDLDVEVEITRIAFSAVLGIETTDYNTRQVYVISGSVEIYRGSEPFLLGGLACLWLRFHVPEMAYKNQRQRKSSMRA
jgi:hypothetical protein